MLPLLPCFCRPARRLGLPSMVSQRPKIGQIFLAKKLITELEKRMRSAAKGLEFEEAARLRDRIKELRRQQIFKT